MVAVVVGVVVGVGVAVAVVVAVGVVVGVGVAVAVVVAVGVTDMANYRLVPRQQPGKGWFVELRSGSKKAGTLKRTAVTDPVYTLAQAETFISNNKSSFFSHAVTE